MSRPFLQQLRVATPGVLPPLVFVDVASLGRWSSSEKVWKALAAEAVKAPHTLVLVCPVDRPELLRDFPSGLAPVVVSTESAGTLAARQGAGLLVANVEEHPSQLWPLGAGVPAALDAADGRLWTPEQAEMEFGTLNALLERELILDADGRPLVPEATRYTTELRRASSLDEATLQASGIPSRVVRAIISKGDALSRAVAKTLGNADPAARAQLTLLSSHNRVDSYYVVATVRQSRVHAVVAATDTVAAVDGEEQSLRLLREMVLQCPDARWFVPQALSLLAAMTRAGLPLPARVVDPALVAYVLDPERPPPLTNYCRNLYQVSPATIARAADLRREHPFERSDLRRLVSVLPLLDSALRRACMESNLTQLVEDDLARTLGALGSIEGAGILTASQGVMEAGRADLLRRYSPILHEAAFALGEDPSRLSEEQLCERVFRRFGRLPADRNYSLLSGRQLLGHHAALGSPRAKEVVTALELAETLRWWEKAENSGGWLSGQLKPTKNGRWTPAFHSLVAHTAGARELRSHLLAPPGTTLLSADWRAFEARILASVTGDQFLLSACVSDPYAVLADRLGTTRAVAKQLLVPIAYGLTRRTFVTSHELPAKGAERLFDAAYQLVPRLWTPPGRTPLDGTRTLRTQAGWRRVFHGDGGLQKMLRSIANFQIQGIGADLLRFVLQRLAQELPRVGATLIHQAHDEVVVAAPSENVARVTTLLDQVMGVDAGQQLRRPVSLPVRITQGATWAALK